MATNADESMIMLEAHSHPIDDFVFGASSKTGSDAQCLAIAIKSSIRNCLLSRLRSSRFSCSSTAIMMTDVMDSR